MKKALIIFMVLFLAVGVKPLFAQQIGDLKGIGYQAVAIDEYGKEIVGMDVNGKPLYNKTIGVRFSILKGSANGAILYQETDTVLTDQYGLFSLVIGQGINTNAGQYDKLMEIPWIDADQFLKVEIATKNDDNYKMVSNQQFMSVPYSFYTDDIADNAITSAKILDAAIINQDIADNAVTSSKVLDGTLINADIADDAITSSKVLDGTLINTDIADNAITTSKILDASILNEDILDSTIDLTSKVTKILPVSNGGTGVSSIPSGGLMLGSTGDSIISLGQATDGQIPIGATGGNPVLANLTAGAGIVVTNTPGGIQISSGVQGVNSTSAGNIQAGIIASMTTFETPAISGIQGVQPGTMVIASCDKDLQGCMMTGYVTGNNIIRVAIFNGTTKNVNLGQIAIKILIVQ